MWSRQYLQQQNQVAAKNMNPYVSTFPFIMPLIRSVLSVVIHFQETGALYYVIYDVALTVSSGPTRMCSDSSQTTRKLPSRGAQYSWLTTFLVTRCCTVNHPQGWPKFISNAFVTTADKTSLAHVYLGSYSVNTTLANGQWITVTLHYLCATDSGRCRQQGHSVRRHYIPFQRLAHYDDHG